MNPFETMNSMFMQMNANLKGLMDQQMQMAQALAPQNVLPKMFPQMANLPSPQSLLPPLPNPATSGSAMPPSIVDEILEEARVKSLMQGGYYTFPNVLAEGGEPLNEHFIEGQNYEYGNRTPIY